MLSKRLAALLLALAFSAAPELVWLGAHALSHHHHAELSGDRHQDVAEHAEALAHGHHHSDAEPEHDHDLAPSPPSRRAPPREMPAPEAVSLKEPCAAPLPSGAGFRSQKTQPAGASPPLLHLHCVLLI